MSENEAAPQSNIELGSTIETSTNTVAEMLEQGQALFEQSGVYFGHGTDNAWDEAVYLLSFVLSLAPDVDRAVLEKVLSPTAAGGYIWRSISDVLMSASPRLTSPGEHGFAACLLSWTSA